MEEAISEFKTKSEKALMDFIADAAGVKIECENFKVTCEEFKKKMLEFRSDAELFNTKVKEWNSVDLAGRISMFETRLENLERQLNGVQRSVSILEFRNL